MTLTPHMQEILAVVLAVSRRLEAVPDRPPPGTDREEWRDLWRERQEYQAFGVRHDLARWFGHAATASESAVFSRALRNMEAMSLVFRVNRWGGSKTTHVRLTATGRAEAERMIREAENGPDFQTILCYDMSRFSRGGTNETGYYLHRLSMAGVEAVFCAEGIPEGEEGELLQGVKSWQARQYSVKLARDTIRGQISNILERRCAPGGTPPYGYDKQHVTAAGQVLRTFRWLPDGRKQEFSPEGKLVRVLESGETVKKARSDIVRYVPSTPERIAVVRRIFEQSVAGYGSRHTAARLNDEGIPSVDGKKWNSNQVRRLLANPAYRGALVWNKRTLGKINGVGRDGKLRPRRGAYTQKQNPVEDWFVVEGVHEPLVSPEVFEKAQRAHRARRGQGGRAKTVNRALLSGLITCRHCGWHFGQLHTNYTFQGKRTRFRYYIDRGYHTGGKAVCKATFIPADALDAWVVGKVRDVLLGDAKTVEAAVDAFVKRILGSRKPAGDTAGVERDLDAVSRRIQATVAMLADPMFDGLEELKKTLADLKAKRDALQARLKREKVPADVPLREADLRAWARDRIRQIEKVLAGRMPTMEARRVVHAFVDRIEVDPHRRCGVLFLPADAASSFARETSTRGALGDPRGGVKAKGEA
jgi:DNA invertase Pin-like site-specific DNA recombinase